MSRAAMSEHLGVVPAVWDCRRFRRELVGDWLDEWQSVFDVVAEAGDDQERELLVDIRVAFEHWASDYIPGGDARGG